ncbi:MAG: CoA-binding protein [Phycisphaeraceae bacterium]|nr:CoA-binding protein [Phycisphaeraceae bacterium]
MSETSIEDLRRRIEAFLAVGPWAVVGASTDRNKVGNMVLRAYLQSGRQVWPVNPRAQTVENTPCFSSLEALPSSPHGVSIITPPAVTATVVESAIRLGIGNLWIQPGAEDEQAIERARAAGINCISGGPCILVELGFRG